MQDADWVVIGSGFGGSVAALRLAERGYSVRVLECGQRFTPDTMPRSAWNLRRYFWMPKLGMHGMLRISNFRDVSILSGSAVGGGSVVYAQTLYRATKAYRDAFNEAVGEDVDLDPFYDVAERMLGATTNTRRSVRDQWMLDAGRDLGYDPDRFHPSCVGVHVGLPGERVADPYFDGEGPERTGCLHCGQCLLGCRHDAKNSLDKNYLWLAERRGVEIRAGRLVTDVRPLGAADGSDGYEVTSVRPGSWIRRDRQTIRAAGVVFAAGAVGTNTLLAQCRASGSLPELSDRLGANVRTNAESVCALTPRDPDADLTDGVTITGSLWPTDDLHLEAFTYGGVGDPMGLMFVPLSGDGTRVTRPLKLLGKILRHPVDFLRSTNPVGWSRRSMMIGGMWTRDGAIRFIARRRRTGGIRLQTEQDADNPNPTYIPEMVDFVEHLAKTHDAVPQIWLTEPFKRSFTAHILGGAVLATSPGEGVVDPHHRVFGYRNLLVCDGAAVPHNPGVNPSLTITALAERAMASMPAKDGSLQRGGVGFRAGSTTKDSR